MIIRFGLRFGQKQLFGVWCRCACARHPAQDPATGRLAAIFCAAIFRGVAMESGSGAHHWARRLQAMGHDARIIDPRFVFAVQDSGRFG